MGVLQLSQSATPATPHGPVRIGHEAHHVEETAVTDQQTPSIGDPVTVTNPVTSTVHTGILLRTWTTTRIIGGKTTVLQMADVAVLGSTATARYPYAWLSAICVPPMQCPACNDGSITTHFCVTYRLDETTTQQLGTGQCDTCGFTFHPVLQMRTGDTTP